MSVLAKRIISGLFVRTSVRVDVLFLYELVHQLHSAPTRLFNRVIYFIGNDRLLVWPDRKANLLWKFSLERDFADVFLNSIVINTWIKKERAHLHAVPVYLHHEGTVDGILVAS